MHPHLEREHRGGEDKADPEATGHVREFGAWSGFRGDHYRFECHPTDGAGTGFEPTDLRVHRAGVFDVLVGRGGRRGGWGQCVDELARVRLEPGPAVRRAEVVGLAVVVDAVHARVRIYRHPAHGIMHDIGGGRRSVVMVVMLGHDRPFAFLDFAARHRAMPSRHHLHNIPLGGILRVMGRFGSLTTGHPVAGCRMVRWLRSTAAAPVGSTRRMPICGGAARFLAGQVGSADVLLKAGCLGCRCDWDGRLW